VIIGHTNEPEYKKLQNNELMEAFRDRTIKIDIPYNTQARRRDPDLREGLQRRSVPGKHIAPHTLETAAMWAVLTRLEEPKKANLTLLQKLKLYNGKTLPGFTEDNVKELREESPARRHGGHLAALHPGQDLQRAGQREQPRSINPFMVMNELESGLDHHSLINERGDQEALPRLLTVVGRVRGHHQERGPARDLAPTRRPSSGSAATTSTTSRPTRRRRRSRTPTPARTRSRTSG
jgi:serine protein kinase